MLRNILRTSRWLARRRINNVKQYVTPEQCAAIYIQDVADISKSVKNFGTTPDLPQSADITLAVFEEICNETLESISDYFEEIVENDPNFKGADITYSDGVLTIALGPKYGTYVINRQTPNRQIWLSSPVSGPKRYDLVLKNGGYWIYKHDGVTLHKLLQEEISKLVPNKINFETCAHSS